MEGVKISQRARLLALLLGILILGVLGQSFVINSYLLENFRRLEETQVRSNARLIRLWLDNFLQPLDATARVITSAAPAPPEEWAARVIATAQNRGAGLDAAAQFGPDGRIQQGFSVETLGAPGPLSDFTAQYLARHTGSAAAAGHSLSGWIATPRGMLATASRAQGTTRVVLARYFTTDDLVTLEDLSGTKLELHRSDETGAPFGAGSVRGELQRGGHDNQALQLCSPLTPALNPGDDLEREAGRANRLDLLGEPPEDRRVAPLQPHHVSPTARALHQ